MSEKKRVAAYCRVSTNKEIQQSSLALQTEVFEQIATRNPNWTLVKVYADEGLTGTCVKNRVQFQQMIKDALEGKIDYIIAKSISRFARNTVDTLKYTRLLKEKGIGVYFEEQSLDTLNVTSEIFLTIHAAFAQEESHSISENQKRGYRNRYALGVPKWSATFGYRCEENGEWITHKKEAKIVKLIFEKYLAGDSIPDICRHLMSKRVTPPEGEKTWHPHTVSMILHNEKYIGDVEMQKSYTVSHLTHKKVKNDGKKIPKYYIHDHHTAIIERDDFEIAQRILAMRDSHKGCYQYPFYGLLKCPFCGENMAAVPLRTRGLERAWTCIGKNGKTRRERTDCPPACVKEKYILRAVLQAFREGDKNIRSLEYPMIYREIEHITFDSFDWHMLIIFWKNGQQSRVHIDYEKKSEVPANEIVIQDKSVYLDGVLMGSSPQDMTAAKSILSIREYLQNVRITDTDTLINGSGAADAIGNLVSGMNLSGGMVTICVIITLTLLLSDVTSNTATAAVAIPVVISIIQGIGKNPIPFIYIASVGVNLSYMLPTSIRAIPVGYGLEPKYMFKEGWKITILVIVLMTITCSIMYKIWPAFSTV